MHSSNLADYQLLFNNTYLPDGQRHRQKVLNGGIKISLRAESYLQLLKRISHSLRYKHTPIRGEITETFLTTLCVFVVVLTESFACTLLRAELTLHSCSPLSVLYCITPAPCILPVFLYILSSTAFITTLFEYHSPVH